MSDASSIRGRAPGRTLGRGDRLAAVVGLAGRAAGQPGVHDLPDGQAVPPGATARRPAGRLRAHLQPLHGPLGRRPDALARARCYQLWRFENLLRPGELYQGHDRLYVPKVGQHHRRPRHPRHRHRPRGRPVFVATDFGCLATLSERSSFTPLWRPPFLSKLAAEDRCHLNGLALEDGRPRYVTAVSTSDVVDGWRDRRQDGGVVLEVPDGRVIASGLSMPHSPRLYRGRLWLHNSGTGQFGSIDPGGGRIRAADLLPRLPARPGLRRRLRRGRPVPAAPRQDLQRPGTGRRTGQTRARSPGAAC